MPAHPTAPPTDPARRLWARGLIGVTVLQALPRAPSQAAQTAGREIRVITGPDSPSARQMLQALKQRWPALMADANPAAWEARKGPAIHIALGTAALQKALGADLKGPVLSVMGASQVYRQLVQPAWGDEARARDKGAVTALYADTSPSSQLLLAQALLGNRMRIGVLLSEASAHLEKSLLQAAGPLGIALEIEHVPAPSTDAARALTRLRDVQALLAVADSNLYTPETLRTILESTYRRSMPVIGFSAATVAAGTLASTYSSIDDMAAEVADMVDELMAGNVPEARHPRRWRVAINDNVARSLGIQIEDRARQLSPSAAGRSA
ncbi:MAG: ABC transporter substrate binding protein [Aquabacterium sp.]